VLHVSSLILYVPFAYRRYGMSMEKEIGIYCDEQNGEYRGRCSVHLDAIYWVKRDSYLPQGSQGLKAVTRAKLGYDPVEVSLFVSHYNYTYAK
jgi:hypothetical protein